ncbi:MAG: hypothetical protein Q8R44_08005 [Novosphingobium sp.]|nr:hypothetical protein [Novosphingobium sp.]
MLAATVTCPKGNGTIVNPTSIPVHNLDRFLEQSPEDGKSLTLRELIMRSEKLRNDSLRAAARADALSESDSASAKASVGALRAAIAAASAANTGSKTLIEGLSAVPSGGNAPRIVAIARQAEIAKLLNENDSARLLILKQTPASAFYTKDNLWTFFGGPPLYAMGGVSLSYAIVEPATGTVKASGVIAEHGGYRSVRRVEQLIARANAAP